MRNGQIRFVCINEESDVIRAMRDFQAVEEFLSDKLSFESLVTGLARIDIYDLYFGYYDLKQCTVVGMVERRDESLVLAEDILRNYFPRLNLSYIKQNVSCDRTGSINERLQS